MSLAQTASTSGVSGATGSQSPNNNPLGNMTTNDFLNMLVTELQQQDPTQPVDSSQILDQVSQIDQIQSNQSLSTTLNSVLLEQNVATGSALLNQTITGTDAKGNAVNGTVSQVSISSGAVQLQVGNSTVPIANVTGIGGNSTSG
jgi:flagellar basal-body rod modification protein FlgD